MDAETVDKDKVFNTVIDGEVADEPSNSPTSSVPQIINLNEHKAGLVGLDKEKINKIIQEASKGSAFYNHQQIRQKRINKQIEQHKKKLALITEAQRSLAIAKADATISALETTCSLNHIMVHFDMDMFFAAVEIKYNPSLADKPMAVGSLSMISTSNYLARKYGVRSAMPGFVAKKLCPELILVGSNFQNYSKESKFIMDIISEYDQHLSSHSLDEVYIDLTDYVFDKYSSEKSIDITELYALKKLPDEIWNYAFTVVDNIRARILKESQLSVSAGIACNTLLAKVCTDFNKPNGQFMVKGDREEMLQFVSGIEVRKFPGVGPVSGQILAAFNINHGKDLFSERATLFSIFSETNAAYYMRIGLGIGSSFISNIAAAQKSHSRERTVGALTTLNDMFALLEKISHKLSNDLKTNDQRARTITLKLKKTNFEVFLRSKSINGYTDDEQTILQVAKDLLRQEVEKSPSTSYRLIGLKASNLKDKESSDGTNSQPTLLQFIQKASTSKKSESAHVLEDEHEEDVNVVKHTRCNLCGLEFEDVVSFDLHKLDCEGDIDGLITDDEDGIYIDKVCVPELTKLSDSTDLPSTSGSNNGYSADPNLPYSSIERITCPVCHVTTLYDNEQLNRHLDVCLNKNVVIELTTAVSSTTPNSSPSTNPAAKTKRILSKSSEKKSTKRARSQLDSLNHSQIKIEHFFAKK